MSDLTSEVIGEAQQKARKLLMIGGTVLRITGAVMIKKVVRVLAAIHESHLPDAEKARRFFDRKGSHVGFLQIRTEDKKGRYR